MHPADLSSDRKISGSNLRLRLQGLPRSCFVGRIGAIRDSRIATTSTLQTAATSPSPMASKTSCYRHAIRDSRIATSANKLVGKLQAGIFLWSTKSARAVAWLLIQRLPFCSRLSKRLQEGTKTPRSSEVYIEAIAHIFPYSSCSRIYSGGWAIGEGYETANCSSRADVASCVPSICR